MTKKGRGCFTDKVYDECIMSNYFKGMNAATSMLFELFK